MTMNEHESGELALAAAVYASPVLLFKQQRYAHSVAFTDPFPWDHSEGRPREGNVLKDNYTLPTRNRVRQLVKAGALIAAEIDRILRKQRRSRGG